MRYFVPCVEREINTFLDRNKNGKTTQLLTLFYVEISIDPLRHLVQGTTGSQLSRISLLTQPY